ncbi:RNA-binding protein 39-like [Etheostoma spectabile]|uniref:RNA-binding protein 39-like n=1 Tax=Etheostoma spectabile TaxID=54343 RepID=UPI0013AEF273|nr:RNA-binding protein 39-like [Etheostoma spectabile]
MGVRVSSSSVLVVALMVSSCRLIGVPRRLALMVCPHVVLKGVRHVSSSIGDLLIVIASNGVLQIVVLMCPSSVAPHGCPLSFALKLCPHVVPSFSPVSPSWSLWLCSSRRRSKSKSPVRKEKSPVRLPTDTLTPEERDARTVFCMQLAARIRPRDLEDFFSAVGNVRDVRMISDRNSRKSKGIAYIEFVEATSVPLAIGLTGQRLLGVPIIVQASQAEKTAQRLCRLTNASRGSRPYEVSYVGVALQLQHHRRSMLRGIFEPFARNLESIQLTDRTAPREHY